MKSEIRRKPKLENRNWKLAKWVLISAFYFLISPLLFATDTGTLRPTADGSFDSASFTNGTTSCNATNCYVNVDETSGSSCPSTIVPSDGASTIITSSTNGAKQSFTVDLSSIPDGNVITAVNVYTCATRGQTSDSARLITVVGGTETDCGSTFAPGSSYAAYNCALTLSSPVVKGAGTVGEIGVAMTAARTINFSSFAAVVTYAPPGGRKGQVMVSQIRKQKSEIGTRVAQAYSCSSPGPTDGKLRGSNALPDTRCKVRIQDSGVRTQKEKAVVEIPVLKPGSLILNPSLRGEENANY